MELRRFFGKEGMVLERMSRNQKNNKVIRYRKPIRINIGAIIFVILFVYMVVNIGIYLSKDHIAIYEVVKKSIADDNCVTGLVLRDETVYYTDKAGYINYFYQEGSKVSKKSQVYTIDESGSIYSMLSSMENETSLSEADIKRVRSSISSFRDSYSDCDYEKISSLKYDLENDIMEINNASMLEKLQEVLKDSGNSGVFSTVNSKESGIIAYTVDGMEELKLETLTKQDFDSSAYAQKQQNTRSTEVTASGSPVYKLANSEDWQIVLPLTEEQYEKVKDLSVVSLTFVKDGIDTKASIETTVIEGENYAVLSLNRFMVRYINDRYLEVELKLNAATGLKIPVSAVTTKDFYVIPADYYSSEEETGKTGVMAEGYDEKEKKSTTEFL